MCIYFSKFTYQCNMYNKDTLGQAENSLNFAKHNIYLFYIVVVHVS